MIFDSRIVQRVTSKEFKKNQTEEKYLTFMKTIFPSYESEYIDMPHYDSFLQVMVTFVPVHTQFHIIEYDGSESIEIFDPSNYFTA